MASRVDGAQQLSLIEFPGAKQIKHFKWFSLLSRNAKTILSKPETSQ